MFNNKKKTAYGRTCITFLLLYLFSKIKSKGKILLYSKILDSEGLWIIESCSLVEKFQIQFLSGNSQIYLIKVAYGSRLIEFRGFEKLIKDDFKKIARCFTINGRVSTDTLVVINLFLKWLTRLLDLNFNLNIKNFLTISSLSLKIFTKEFNIKNVSTRISHDLDLILRESFLGGRVELLGNTNLKVYHYDFPGMYGMCMREKFPCGDFRIIGSDEINKKDPAPGFYTISWKSINLTLPVLPAKNTFGKLVFENGTGYGTYWFEEILFFISQGGQVLTWDRAVVFSEFDYVFTDFIEFFERFRNFGNSYKVFSKTVINSLYGKLGSRSKRTKHVLIKTNQEMEELLKTTVILSTHKINKFYIVEIEKSVQGEPVNVGLASCITSKARIKLARTIAIINSEGGRLLYCDTDSVFVEYKNKPIHSSINWDHEGEIYDKAYFASLKSYAFTKNKKNTIVGGKNFSISGIEEFKNLNPTPIYSRYS